MLWYRRPRCIQAIVRHVSVAGDQISPASTDCDESHPSRLSSPPTASTSPSGSSTRLWNARGNAIGAV